MDQSYQVVVTPQAEDSLRQIVDYLLETASEEVAEKVRLGLIEEIKQLRRMPERHGLLNGMDHLALTYRRVLKWSYRIIYTIEETDGIVIVVEIDHARRNPGDLEQILI